MRTNEIQKRTLKLPVEIEVRTEGEKGSRTVKGKAITYDEWSPVYWYFKERISPDALKETDLSDVVATFNHNFDYPMARTNVGTLKLDNRSDGLYFEFDAPNTTAGNDLLENIRVGNIQGCSFMFTIDAEEWEWKSGTEADPDLCTITKIGQLRELGPVTMPFYPSTSVSARTREEVMERVIPKRVSETVNFDLYDARIRMSNRRNKIK